MRERASTTDICNVLVKFELPREAEFFALAAPVGACPFQNVSFATARAGVGGEEVRCGARLRQGTEMLGSGCLLGIQERDAQTTHFSVETTCTGHGLNLD